MLLLLFRCGQMRQESRVPLLVQATLKHDHVRPVSVRLAWDLVSVSAGVHALTAGELMGECSMSDTKIGDSDFGVDDAICARPGLRYPSGGCLDVVVPAGEKSCVLVLHVSRPKKMGVAFFLPRMWVHILNVDRVPYAIETSRPLRIMTKPSAKILKSLKESDQTKDSEPKGTKDSEQPEQPKVVVASLASGLGLLSECSLAYPAVVADSSVPSTVSEMCDWLGAASVLAAMPSSVLGSVLGKRKLPCVPWFDQE